jgi:hypothetical protein
LRQGGDRLLLGYVLNQLGLDLWLVGDVERTATVLDESLYLSREAGDAITRSGALRNLGTVARFQGEYERAATLLRESITQGESATFRDGWAIARGLRDLARVAYLQDELQREEALDSIEGFRRRSAHWSWMSKQSSKPAAQRLATADSRMPGPKVSR